MADERTISVGFVNIVATPHPKGIYESALAAVANKPVNIRGRDWGIITKPIAVKGYDNLREGIVSVWTDIDSSEPSIDKATFKKVDVEAALREIFAKRGFNNRSFHYVLNIERHKVAVELKNDLGKTISVRQAGKLFEMLLSSLNKDKQTYAVTVVPDEDAIDRVLGFERLDRVYILLKRPNPGDHDGGDADEVLRELDEQNLKQAEYAFARQPGTDGIHLNDENETRAEVAAENGYVRSSGVTADGKREKRSTKEYPRIVTLALEAGTAALSLIRDQAQRLRAG
ncbi:DUF4747 family protein [Sphingomonas sp. Leaf67]|uniref:DUF4747 family protein n=1 Tax=Sphingomonas sp. Leaf67 TaxID=1736230 RepID=UPI0009EC0709|nr:DUF4747 family protein [Sphingomonas sp. Leaf67]